ncbi:hypothetical protein QR90_13865 [Deinococcus radiopugnans]|uniref:Uncharacterized protein n=2 Tax=Deinococcus radiopugnans TaxID=57497 RepID=A0A0A7KMR4_9DEIO|nr:hypothetical protein [Deinococcus radiopugnans]AIZ45918.1 hypothetical protein QR90_13865 [Deinococcus radiopugnans]MBB6015998.1 hypothetical protein [Deinococcus radiopugnans ATCC 19172]QLG11776.1 hypothetical protein HLB42_14005 [Deinococcus sp. D7000]TNM72318.1 hypothetical protein FHR04_03175 [Deinococcus radiopugnans ATCC 19172]
MTDSSDRYGSKPLGKSVEEVEATEGNRVNSPVPGEQVRHDQEEVAMIPAVSNSNANTNPGVVEPNTLLTDSVMLEERRDRAQAGPDAGQSSENSES